MKKSFLLICMLIMIMCLTVACENHKASSVPTSAPTAATTDKRENTPTVTMTATPTVTVAPTAAPTTIPTAAPTTIPTAAPTTIPTVAPTGTTAPAPTAEAQFSKAQYTLSELLNMDETILLSSTLSCREYSSDAVTDFGSTIQGAQWSGNVENVYLIKDGNLEIFELSEKYSVDSFLRKSRKEVMDFLSEQKNHKQYSLSNLRYVFYDSHFYNLEAYASQYVEEVMFDNFESLYFSKNPFKGFENHKGFGVATASSFYEEAYCNVVLYWVYGAGNTEFVLDKSEDVKGLTGEERKNLVKEELEKSGLKKIGKRISHHWRDTEYNISEEYDVYSSETGEIIWVSIYDGYRDLQEVSIVTPEAEEDYDCDYYEYSGGMTPDGDIESYKPLNDVSSFYYRVDGNMLFGKGKTVSENGVYYEQIVGSLSEDYNYNNPIDNSTVKIDEKLKGKWDGEINVYKNGGMFPCTFDENADMFNGTYYVAGVDLAQKYMKIYNYAKTHQTESKKWREELLTEQDNYSDAQVCLEVELVPETAEHKAFLKYTITLDVGYENIIESCTGAK